MSVPSCYSETAHDSTFVTGGATVISTSPALSGLYCQGHTVHKQDEVTQGWLSPFAAAGTRGACPNCAKRGPDDAGGPVEGDGGGGGHAGEQLL